MRVRTMVSSQGWTIVSVATYATHLWWLNACISSFFFKSAKSTCSSNLHWKLTTHFRPAIPRKYFSVRSHTSCSSGKPKRDGMSAKVQNILAAILQKNAEKSKTLKEPKGELQWSTLTTVGKQKHAHLCAWQHESPLESPARPQRHRSA